MPWSLLEMPEEPLKPVLNLFALYYQTTKGGSGLSLLILTLP
ncbi:MAG: hypothetical protein QXQ84_00520 [Nitrososphaerota archaeon]